VAKPSLEQSQQGKKKPDEKRSDGISERPRGATKKAAGSIKIPSCITQRNPSASAEETHLGKEKKFKVKSVTKEEVLTRSGRHKLWKGVLKNLQIKGGVQKP